MKRVLLVLSLLLLTGCDQLKDRLGLDDMARQEADGKAVGAACRNAGQGLEDCYRLNPDTGKAAIYAGWKEMNEYMIKNNMQIIPPMSTRKTESAAMTGHEAAATAAAGAKDTAHKTADKHAGDH